MTTRPQNPLLSNILSQSDSLQQCLDYQLNVGQAALQKAAEWLSSARQILFCGMGASYNGSLPLVRFLAENGLPAYLIEAGELLHYNYPHTSADTVFILVSRSGKTIEISRLLPVLQEQGAKVIAISNNQDSALMDKADIPIWTSSPEDSLISIQTNTAMLLTSAILGIMTAQKDLDDWLTETARLIKWTRTALPEFVQGSLGWKNFLNQVPVIYCLGRGKSYASARQGALLFNEIAKFPAIGMDTGDFRHGPLEVMDHNFRGVLFIPQDKTQELNINLARDIARLGGQVRVVSPWSPGKSLENLASWEIFPFSPLLAPIAEIFPLQLAAYRLAEWRSIVPGSARYLGPVMLDENKLPRTIKS